jgi:hypothetical protein
MVAKYQEVCAWIVWIVKCKSVAAYESLDLYKSDSTATGKVSLVLPCTQKRNFTL